MVRACVGLSPGWRRVFFQLADRSYPERKIACSRFMARLTPVRFCVIWLANEIGIPYELIPEVQRAKRAMQRTLVSRTRTDLCPLSMTGALSCGRPRRLTSISPRPTRTAYIRRSRKVADGCFSGILCDHRGRTGADNAVQKSDLLSAGAADRDLGRSGRRSPARDSRYLSIISSKLSFSAVAMDMADFMVACGAFSPV